ncbi:pilus assembly protein N-terminal domain-containing protein [Chlorobaculum sp. MV4-Y]|uniref:type II and III secretion system protein family protein n=1 Tax=Chlorobaculum sp. MV4-Y TaxID=2976335 RepID=UPI0021AF10B8|nr:pilus assembly protein N-terminal domain-containing protein [Chlorobaculum sp. MV4-Y]UWX58016.1 pilus assembly protein N-terminal domain-containing protein [Chlorobaculum sp. MV4-Y]
MDMNLTCVKHLACGMSALVALSGAVPVVVLASPAPVVAVAAPAPIAKKATPVPAKQVAPAPVAKTAAPAPVTTKTTPAPVAKKVYRKPAAKRYSRVRVMDFSAYTPSSYSVPEGESRVYRLAAPAKRVAVGDPAIADFIMISPSEIYLSGKKTGATNLIVWGKNGNSTTAPLVVSRNVKTIQDLLRAVLPKEHDIQLYSSGDALVLAGSVSNALAAETAIRLVKTFLGGTVPDVTPEATLTSKSEAATGTSGGTSISGMTGVSSASGTTGTATVASSGIRGFINLLKIRDPQQVRLEVRIAEVSKAYIESLGFSWTQGVGSTAGSSLMTGFVSNATLNLLLNNSGNLKVEADRKKTWIKMLAEPTIVAMSGQEGYFLVGGKIYTPTPTGNGAVDYQERTYGVGLRFTPTVLDAGRISLKVAPEVSEPDSQFQSAGSQFNLPAFKVSAASTTVEMNEGQNLVIGGLLKDNLTETIQAVPLLGQLPLLGALFRHTSMDSEKVEVIVIVHPTLVKATDIAPEIPTFVPPGPNRLFLEGKLQGSK